MKSILTLVLVVIGLGTAYAQQADDVVGKNFLSGKSDQNESQPTMKNEIFDFRRGELKFELPLFHIPGTNGLDINFGISFAKTPALHSQIAFGSPQKFGGLAGPSVGTWSFEVPRIFAGNYIDYQCGKSPSFVFAEFGSASRVFYRHQSTILGNGYEYISTDNWIAKCEETTTIDPYSGKPSANFIVQSPTGLIYYFRRLVGVNGKTPNLQVSLDNSVYRYETSLFTFESPMFMATKITDHFGNEINYNFANDGVVNSITSNDGRSLTFTWKTVAIQANSPSNNHVVSSNARLLESATSNGRTWKFDYSYCSDNTGTNCFDENPLTYAPGQATTLRIILRKLIRPDNKIIAFKYKNYYHSTHYDGYLPIPGKHFQISSIEYPNQLISKYEFQTSCGTLFDGISPIFEVPKVYFLWTPPPICKPTSMPTCVNPLPSVINSSDTNIYTLNACNSFLNLTKKSYSGLGLVEADSERKYFYYIPGIDGSYYQPNSEYIQAKIAGQNPPSPAGDYTYSFELSKTKMITGKFKRDPNAGDIGVPFNSNYIDAGEILEKGIFPAPDQTSSDLSLPSPLPAAPVVPPSIAVISPQQSYPSGTQIRIDFTGGGLLPVVAANCRLDSGIIMPCTSLNSFVIPAGLPKGLHFVYVNLMDSNGQYSSTITVSFWVGDFPDPNAPVLVIDLKKAVVLPGQRVDLKAQFSGRVTSYVWYKNNVAITNVVGPVFSIPVVSSENFAEYKVVAYNGNSATESSTVRVELDPSVLISIMSILIE